MPNILGIVYNWNLIKINNNWYKALSSYSPTYNFLYVEGLFTTEGHVYKIKDIMLELNKILRSNALVIFRDSHVYLE